MPRAFSTPSQRRCLIIFAALTTAPPPIIVPLEATVEPPSGILEVEGKR